MEVGGKGEEGGEREQGRHADSDDRATSSTHHICHTPTEAPFTRISTCVLHQLCLVSCIHHYTDRPLGVAQSTALYINIQETPTYSQYKLL